VSDRWVRAGDLAALAAAAGLAAWGLAHALAPRGDGRVDADFAAAADHVKARAGPRDFVLVRPIWELAGARAFLPLPTGVYRRPTPDLWQGRDRIWVAAAHGALPPRALRAALREIEASDFGSVRLHLFEVRR
jgi:hypothetical protein